VTDASVSGKAVNLCGPQSYGTYITYSEAIPTRATPANGTLSLPTTFEHFYVTVAYSSSVYSFSLEIAPTQIENVTLFVPSGTLNVTIHRP
jgi:hypothetical protein